MTTIVILVGFGLIMLSCAGLQASGTEGSGLALWITLVGLVAAGVGVYMAAQKLPTIVVVRTSSEDQHALVTKDAELAQQVREAIDEAIVRRG